MRPNGHYGAPYLTRMFGHYFDIARALIMFMLGVALIIYATVTTGHDVPFLVVGLVLCGLVPADLWLASVRRQPLDVELELEPSAVVGSGEAGEAGQEPPG
jgi:hypothetical protein